MFLMSAGRRLLISLVIPSAFVLVATWPSATTAQEPQPENLNDYLPPGDAKDLVVQTCTVCHDLRSTVLQRKSRGAWEGTVLKMVDEGAPLQPEEADKVTEYLSTVFGPESPPLTDVNTASAEDLAKLPGITADLAAKIVAHRTARGPFPTRDDVQGVVGLTDEAFGKIKWYLRAVPPPSR
jgi:competence ComEA-like helix-hairpin-helix protein